MARGESKFAGWSEAPALLCSIAIAALSCSRDDPPPSSASPPSTPSSSATESSEVFAGVYSTGFELSGFTPCAPAEGGWATGSGARALATFHRDNSVKAYHSIYARVRATRRGPGKFGHLGASKFEFDIHEVLEVRLVTPDDCKCVPSMLGCQ